ncbi:homoserine O-acetyltransferase [Panaeolus papilionaceus]|nr:homoserine O-acetyltransferase [Panaeolus papilionaceus]
MSSEPPTQYLNHGRLRVAGGVLPDAKTAYRTYGDPKNPCIVFPTCYGGKLDSQSYMVGENKVLNTKKYFVVTLALFCNGESSSPSNTPAPYNGPYFPHISYEDNIGAQYAVLQKLGIKKVFAVVGFSMGGQQAYYWPVVYPDVVERYVSICGSARTSMHNKCFLEGPKAALVNSKDFLDGHYTSPPQHGLRAFGRAYSAWAYGQTWFRQHGYKQGGRFPDLQSFLREDWEESFLSHWDANDLISLLHTWYNGDVSLVDQGAGTDQAFVSCLGQIKAKGLIMPSKTDLYFPPEDSADEVAVLGNNAKLVVIDTVWGHMAGGGANPQDDEFIANEITKFFSETA